HCSAGLTQTAGRGAPATTARHPRIHPPSPPRTTSMSLALPATTDDLDHLRDLAHVSAEVISQHQDVGGAYPASPTFSAYQGYAWFRDGSFVAEGMSRYGDVESVDRFHRWAVGVLTSRGEHVAALLARAEAGEELPLTDMLPTRFRLDGSDGQDPWWDFQTDGYRSEEHTSELQSRENLVCRLLLEKKKN